MRVESSSIIFTGVPSSSQSTVSFCILVKLQNGDLLATARLGSAKDSADGNIGLWRSTDKGVTWIGPILPFHTDFEGQPGCLRAGGVTELPDGRLLFTLAWVNRSVPGQPLYNVETGGLCEMFPVISESKDGGNSWSPLRRVNLLPVKYPAAMTGPTLKLTNGSLACQMEVQKSWRDPSPIFNLSALKISHDGGLTWPEYVPIAGRDTNGKVCWDQRIARRADGGFVNLFWTYDTVSKRDLTIHASYGSPDGRLWSEPRDTGIIGQIAMPVVLDDGRMVMLYVRRDDKQQLLARISRDGGQSWDATSEIMIYDHRMNAANNANLFKAMNQWAYGHPWGVPVEPQLIALVFYAGRGETLDLRFLTIRVE